MDRATARRLARALIAPAEHTQHSEERLDTCIDLAIATYRAIAAPHSAVTSYTNIITRETDEVGSYTLLNVYAPAAIAALAHPGAEISIADKRPKWRLETITSSNAYVRVYEHLDTPPVITVWAPANAWSDAHHAVIALLAASYYAYTLALAEGDPRRAEIIADIASTYYGRAMALIRER